PSTALFRSDRGGYMTIPAHSAVLSHPEFLTAHHHTRWLEESIELVEESPMATPSLPEEEALQQRTMTVEIGGRRFSVTFWAPEPGVSGGSVRQIGRASCRG